VETTRVKIFEKFEGIALFIYLNTAVSSHFTMRINFLPKIISIGIQAIKIVTAKLCIWKNLNAKIGIFPYV